MGDLSETSAFFGVEVDVVDPERGIGERKCSGVSIRNVEIREVIELNVNFNFMVLESNEGQGETRVSAEPELKRDVDTSLRLVSTLDAKALGELANHFLVTGFLTVGDNKLTPDFQPVAVVLIDALTSDFNLDVVHDEMTNRVDPSETSCVGIADTNSGKRGLKIDTVNEITISGNCASYTTSEIGISVECLFNRLHSEIGMTTINYLEVSNLRITSKIDVLCSVSDELH